MKSDTGLSTAAQLINMCRQLKFSDPSGSSSKQLRGKKLCKDM